MTLGQWLINLLNTKDWRAGKVKGSKHPKMDEEMIAEIGSRKQILAQAAELEKAGIITVNWKSVRTDIECINISVDKMDELCSWEGMENPKKKLLDAAQTIQTYKAKTKEAWLKDYYEGLLAEISRGKLPANASDELLFCCLNALERLKDDTWKRLFSSAVLSDSKLFEKKYETKFLTILKKNSPLTVDGMEDSEILAEHGILTYAQKLELKGPLHFEIDSGVQKDTVGMYYGAILNAQTLAHARPVSIGNVKRIVTIENKANYENMEYNDETIYIFTHGFLSPKERLFLRKIRDIAGQFTVFYHWGDMDYGGIRIFLFLKERVFPGIQPYFMDEEAYDSAVKAKAVIKLDAGKREKLEKLEAGELEGLKSRILEYGLEIEQEALLAGSVLNGSIEKR